MRSKEYVDKYFSKEFTSSSEDIETAKNFFVEFINESLDIIKIRNCKTMRSGVAVILETEKKYFSIVDKALPKGWLLQRNGYRTFINNKYPDIARAAWGKVIG